MAELPRLYNLIVLTSDDLQCVWLADGFHRYWAAMAIEAKDLLCEVRQGTVRNAILYSVGANAKHGLRRTNADKRKAVLTMLTNPLVSVDDDGNPWSNNAIAQRCQVDPKAVASVRSGMEIHSCATRKGTDGKLYNTANIGRNREDRSDASEGGQGPRSTGSKRLHDATIFVRPRHRKDRSGLQWRHLEARSSGGQVSYYGKGAKTRVVLLPPELWADLQALRGRSGHDDPVFQSRKHPYGPLTREQIFRIVQDAGRRAGIPKAVCTHMLRHSHASHSLDRGAPIHVVQSTLGHASLTTTSRYVHARPTESSSQYLSG